MSDRRLVARSLFFVPGDRPDMVAKVPRWSPDVVVVDLEDAVAPTGKAAARGAAVAAIDRLDVPADTTVLIRVNPPGTPWFAEDVAAAAGSRAAGVVLPKLQDRAQLHDVRQRLGEGGCCDPVMICGLETARGVADSRPLLAGGVDAVYFGAEDYIADLGGRRTTGGHEVLHARSEVILAARLAGITAIDQAVVAVHDEQRFVADAEAGRALGYHGKICVHPRQVPLAHRVFTPSSMEVEHARAVVEAGKAGVALVDGEMVDEVHLKLATAVLEAAKQGRAGAEDTR